jgi:2-succinyl-6-hydroxy-2,4-cyclohexadiene-1-carboxylate synthase
MTPPETALKWHTRRRGSGIPLVLLHGFMESGGALAPLANRLNASVGTLRPDLPGHGASRFATLPIDRRPADVIGAARMVLDDLTAMGMVNFFVYGYSMGGRVAQLMAIAAPGRVSGLILESAGFGLPDQAARARRRAADAALLAGVHSRQDLAGFLKRWHTMPLFCTLAGHPGLPVLIRAKKKNDPAELRRALAVLSAGNQPFTPPLLAAAGVPIHYLFGRQDRKYRETAEEAAHRIPGMICHPFEAASHNVHFQFPEAVAALIDEIVALPATATHQPPETPQ